MDIPTELSSIDMTLIRTQKCNYTAAESEDTACSAAKLQSKLDKTVSSIVKYLRWVLASKLRLLFLLHTPAPVQSQAGLFPHTRARGGGTEEGRGGGGPRPAV